MSRNTVLIVEPDNASRSALRTTFEGNGYTVVEAAGASAALALVNQKEIALVVTELYLASETQRCLLPAIRSSSALRRTKVLAYTTHSAKKDRDWAIAEGADGYVLKHNGQERLLQVMGNLGRSRRRKRRPRPDAN